MRAVSWELVVGVCGTWTDLFFLGECVDGI